MFLLLFSLRFVPHIQPPEVPVTQAIARLSHPNGVLEYLEKELRNLNPAQPLPPDLQAPSGHPLQHPVLPWALRLWNVESSTCLPWSETRPASLRTSSPSASSGSLHRHLPRPWDLREGRRQHRYSDFHQEPGILRLSAGSWIKGAGPDCGDKGTAAAPGIVGHPGPGQTGTASATATAPGPVSPLAAPRSLLSGAGAATQRDPRRPSPKESAQGHRGAGSRSYSSPALWPQFLELRGGEGEAAPELGDQPRHRCSRS